MMRVVCKKWIFAILSVLFSLWVVIAGVMPAKPPIQAKADTVLSYEQTNVLDDLKNSTIGGKEFSLEDFNFSTRKKTQVLYRRRYNRLFFRLSKTDKDSTKTH